MKPILEFALDIAREAHKGQKRRDGKAYITHPIAVVRILEENYMTQNPLKNTLILCAGYLHDLAEDCNITEQDIADNLVFNGGFAYMSEDYVNLIAVLKLLNKNHYQSYAQYIQGFIASDLDKKCMNDNFLMRYDVARRVKLADLTHNVSDLKPGSQRDKYELAKYILEKN